MNKFFALSLLMLSPSVIYACHNHEEKSCCTAKSAHCSQNVSHDTSELKKFAVEVDVEIKLPDHFKQRLVEGSETKFTVNLDNKTDAIGHSFFGLYLNKNRIVEAYAGKGKIGPSQQWVSLLVERTNDPDWVNIKLNSELKNI